MPRTSKARIFRSTLTSPNSGSVRDLTTAFGTGANATTSAQYAAAGTVTWRRWNPNSATTTAVDPATVTTSEAAQGWRDTVAENANEQLRYNAGTWTVRVRLTKTGQALAADITVRVTVIVYRVTSAGAHVAEIGRATTADTTLSTATLTLTPSFTTGSALTFDAGDKLQIECYVTPVVAGMPAAPAAAVNVNFVVDETSANSGASFTAIPTYDILYSKSISEVARAGDTLARALVTNRSTEEIAVSSDSLTRSLAFPRASSDTARASDSIVRSLVLARGITDTARAADTIARAILVARSMSDTAKAVDTLTRSTTVARSVGDSANAADVLTRSTVTARTLGDVAIAIDSLIRSLAVSRSMTDISRATDSLTRTYGAVRGVSDAAKASDSVGRTVSFTKSLTDTAFAGDVASRMVVVSRSMSDIAKAGDVLARTQTLGRLTSDSARAFDDLVLTAIFNRGVFDTARAGDVIAATLVLARSLFDFALASDVLVRSINYERITREYIGGPADFAVELGTKFIAGVTRNTLGEAVGGKVVKLFRQVDDVMVQQQISSTAPATLGQYSFVRDRFDTNAYYVLSYDENTPQTHGVSDRGLVPV